MIEDPRNPTPPSVILTASSTSVGVCDDLTVDGSLQNSASSGSGGRGIFYHYSVKWVAGPHGAASLSAVSAALDHANQLDGHKGAFRVVIPSDSIPRGTVMDVTLQATNFLGLSNSAEIRIRKLSVPAPDIRIMGDPLRSDATYSTSLKLRAVASMPVLSCVDSTVVNESISYGYHRLLRRCERIHDHHSAG